MSRADRLALLLSLLAVLVTYLVTENIFESMPHIEDEMAYVWQAQAMAGRHLTLPSPPEAKSFLVPFVVDFNGQRFGKYPPGWPAVLALGVLFGARSMVNPLLAGLGVWLTYRLGKRIFSETVGLLAAVLTLTSPFFLINSGSLLSHPFGLVLSAAFALAWLDAWEDEAGWRWVPIFVAALSLGLLALSRPLTAVGVSVPFVFHGIYLFIRKSSTIRLRLVIFGLAAMAVASLLFVWQFAVTGDPLLNPYTLWWPYDKIGFGPGVGRLEGGHTLRQARINTRFSLDVGWVDLFGWARYSWLFLPFGVLAVLRRRLWKALLPASIFPVLVVVYLAYWIGSSLFGPRYYYEGIFSLTLISAAGIAWLAGWPLSPGERWNSYTGRLRLRPLLVTAIFALLLSANLIFFMPTRLQSMYGLYGVSRAHLRPFLAEGAADLTPALVIVHPDKWIEYGTLLDLETPFLNTPFLLVINRGEKANAAVAAAFPYRRVYHYYPDEPWIFHKVPHPED